MITTTDSTKAFDAAFLAAQMSIDAVARDATNPQYRKKYPTLSAVLGAVKGPLNENGITIMQSAVADMMPSQIVALFITTRLTHVESGEWKQTTIPIPIENPTFRDKQTGELHTYPITANKTSGAFTYGKRIALSAMCGLEEEDDDGAAASDQRDARPQRPASGYNDSRLPRANGQTRERQIDWQAVSDKMRNEIAACETVAELEEWGQINGHVKDQMPNAAGVRINRVYLDRLNQLEFAAASGVKAGVDPQAPPPDDDLEIPAALRRSE